MQRHQLSIDRTKPDLTLPETAPSNYRLDAAAASTTSRKAAALSDSDLSDDTVSSSEGSFKLPVLSDYAKKVLLTDPLNKSRLGQAAAPSSSTPNILSASASSPLRLFGTSVSATNQSTSTPSIVGNMSPTLATARKQYRNPRASPINGSRQQNEVQRHLNRVRQGMKSPTGDELNNIRTSANNTNNNINNDGTGCNNNTATSTNTGNSYGKSGHPDRQNSVDLPHLASPSLHHSNIMNYGVSNDQNDIQHNISTDENSNASDNNTPRKNSEQYHNLPSPTLDQSEKSLSFHTMARKTASNQSTTQDTNIALGYSTPAITRAGSTRTNLSTIRVKRVGRSLGPPKRAVPRGSDEGLNEHGEFPEESDRSRANKIRFAPTRVDSTSSPPVSTSADDVEMTDIPIADSPMPDADIKPQDFLEHDRKSGSPLTTEQDQLKAITHSSANNNDEINVSEAARKRRSELYEVAERAHTTFDEDNQNNLNNNREKSPKEIERQQTLERQHEELRHQLMIQEQQIKQRKQLVHQIPLPKVHSPPMPQSQNIPSIMNEPTQQQQQYSLMHEQQQQQQQQIPSSREGRKTKNAINVNGQAYQRLELIGRGGSSKVYKVQSNSGKVYAIKRVSCDDDIDHMVLKGFKGEIDLLQRLNDEDRVVKLIDYEMRMSSIYVVMECGEIDLAHVLSARLSQPLDISFVRYYANEMLHCVAAVHRHDIVHSDLKPANFLLVKGMLKIIDFGIANVVPDYTSNVHRDTQIGTPNYMAPEALLDANNVYTTGGKSNEDSNVNKRNSIISLNNSNIYAPSSKPEPSKFKVGRPSDVWSCGCIIYQMIYGRPPYGGYQGTQRMFAIMNPKVRISYPKNGLGQVRVPKEAIEAIKGCLDRDPTQRMTIEQAMNGSFLNPQAVDRRFIQDLLVHAVKYGAERGSAVNERELEMLTDNVWKKIQATNL